MAAVILKLHAIKKNRNARIYRNLVLLSNINTIEASDTSEEINVY